MCDKNRTCSNDAVDKMIGNMTAERQNPDGQYTPLGFNQAPPNTEILNWPNQQDTYVNHYNMHYREHQPVVEPTYQEPPGLNYIPPSSSLFDMYKKNVNLPEYNMYSPTFNGYRNNSPDPSQQASNHTHLIENLVGNWVVPNTSGTYSPFGNTEILNRDLCPHNTGIESLNNSHVDDNNYQFNRDVIKPRLVSEVKPMRPSYSDVLTKPVVATNNQTKIIKSDSKENKVRKDNKKNIKSEKIQKFTVTLNRSNTNNDIKEIPTDKYLLNNKTDKKINKSNKLNRKWASLDNVSEPAKTEEANNKRKKNDEPVSTKTNPKQVKNKLNKLVSDMEDVELESMKSDTFNVSKSNLKKTGKSSNSRKQNDNVGNNDRAGGIGKRNQRARKKDTNVPFGFIGQKIKQYTKGWWKICVSFIWWLYQLITDVCTLSLHISGDAAVNGWNSSKVSFSIFVKFCGNLFQKVRLFSWIWDKLKGRKKYQEDEKQSFTYVGLKSNINMPTTGDEAMKRLLACKGKDPYSILGVMPTCTDDDIKKYYKRQAVLVHPDKNNQPGAEEAFKILVHAFDMISTPARRVSYDRGVAESAHVVQSFTKLTELLQQFQHKMETAATTIRCSACGKHHKRTKMERPSYAARNCNTCKIHHSAREGDIWAEARCLGLFWHYFACMEGAVYDITDWAACQKESLKHLKPDSHHVQYRIALGKHNQPRKNSSKIDRPDLENLLNSLYGQTEGGGTKRRNKNKK